MNFQPVAIGIEPSPYVAVFVVRRVILKCDASHFRINGKSSKMWSDLENRPQK